MPIAYQSIKGDVALDIVTHRSHMNLHKLITQLNNNFGIMSDEDTLMKELYTIKQGPKESVKHFGTWIGFCIDFRKLNTRTKKDSYPLPHIQETLESLEGSHIFSSFDFKLGFWQVEMDKTSKQYTAFTVGSLGFFECECMPFVLCNAPTTFQQLMQNCLGELNLLSTWMMSLLSPIMRMTTYTA